MRKVACTIIPLLILVALILAPKTASAGAGSAIQNSQLSIPFIVGHGNHPPLAQNDAYQTPMDALLAVSAANGVLINDTSSSPGPLMAAVVGDAAHGILTLNADGSFSYAPDPSFVGPDSFTYRASNVWGASNLATVSLTVTDVENDPPQIVSGTIAFSKQLIDGEVKHTHAAEAADLDGDGDMDAVATDYFYHKVYLYLNNGNQQFTKKVLDENLLGAYPIHVGDVDQDGHIDVLAGGYDADIFAWYKNDGQANFTRIIIDATSDGPHSIVTVDLDEDGDVDLLTSSQDANTIAWYENDGAEVFTRHIFNDTALGAKRAAFADLDGDGDLDVASASFDNDEIAWHQNDGDQNFTKRVISVAADGGYYVSPGDADGDGDIDLFTASQLDHTIEWHQNDGAGNFVTHLIDGNAQRARTVIAVDMDRDGDVDAVAASVVDNTVAWHENDGSGVFTKHVIDNLAGGAYGVAAVDMDRDGDLDVLTALKNSFDVVIYTKFRTHSASAPVGGALTIDATLLLTTDPDDGPAELIYTLTRAPGFGELRLDGAPLAASGAFTQADVDTGRLTYVHGGAAGTADGFSFSVADGGESGFRPATGEFLITTY
jgi:hypothetical protein